MHAIHKRSTILNLLLLSRSGRPSTLSGRPSSSSDLSGRPSACASTASSSSAPSAPSGSSATENRDDPREKHEQSNDCSKFKCNLELTLDELAAEAELA